MIPTAVEKVMKSRTVPTWVFKQRKKRERETKGGGERKILVKKSGWNDSKLSGQCVHDKRYDYMSE